MNFYTVTESELTTLEKIGKETAKKLINLRNEVKHGIRSSLTPKDLAEVRLTEADWQDSIDKGIVSLALPTEFVEKGAKSKSVTSEPVTAEYVKEQLTGVVNFVMHEFGVGQTANTETLHGIEAKWDKQMGEMSEKVAAQSENIEKVMAQLALITATLPGSPAPPSHPITEPVTPISTATVTSAAVPPPTTVAAAIKTEPAPEFVFSPATEWMKKVVLTYPPGAFTRGMIQPVPGGHGEDKGKGP